MKVLYLSLLYISGYIIAADAEIPRWYLYGNKSRIVGDMILSAAQMQFLYSRKLTRNAEVDVRSRWPNATVPYQFSSEIIAGDRATITSVLSRAFTKTCVTFRPRIASDNDYVLVVDEGGCYSNVGRVGGMQKLSLDSHAKFSRIAKDYRSSNIMLTRMATCITDHTIAHEFLHAIGLYHQHSAANRDDYISVQWNNIAPDTRRNFEKYEAHRVSSYGEPYDYDSIMHYEKYSGSMNGLPTLIPKKSDARIGKAIELSQSDINKVNKMYNCKKR